MNTKTLKLGNTLSLFPRTLIMAGRRDHSNAITSDEEPLVSLLNPGCGIPPDFYFAIDDEEGGTLVGLLGAHRNLMALKSPVFKTMFYGSVKEIDPVQIKDTSLVAFKEMLKYVHEVSEEEATGVRWTLGK